MFVEFTSDHSFLPELVRKDGVVIDAGLNAGSFSNAISSRCSRVIGFEPDPVWTGKWILPRNVDIFPQAITSRTGIVVFYSNLVKCSSLHYQDSGGERVNVEAVTLEHACNLAKGGRIDLVKIDIEGEEVAVLLEASDELLLQISQITVEFHDFIDPASLPSIKHVINRMKSLGFYVFKFSHRSYGDVLFVNHRFCNLSLLERIWMIGRYKYGRGIGRIIRRNLF